MGQGAQRTRQAGAVPGRPAGTVTRWVPGEPPATDPAPSPGNPAPQAQAAGAAAAPQLQHQLLGSQRLGAAVLAEVQGRLGHGHCLLPPQPRLLCSVIKGQRQVRGGRGGLAGSRPASLLWRLVSWLWRSGADCIRIPNRHTPKTLHGQAACRQQPGPTALPEAPPLTSQSLHLEHKLFGAPAAASAAILLQRGRLRLGRGSGASAEGVMLL